MDNTSLFLSGLLSVTLLILIAPSVIRMNQGRILQNIALWLAIFCALGLAYQTIGPGKDKLTSTTQQQQQETMPADQADILSPRT